MAKLVIGNNKTVGVPVITKEIEKLPALGLTRAKDANGKLIPSKTESQIMDFTGVTDVGTFVLASAYQDNTAISGVVDMSDVVMISGISACENMCYRCTGISSVDLGSLSTASGGSACKGMFTGCVNLTNINMSSIIIVNGSAACNGMFYGCTGLTSVDMSSLTTVSGSNGSQYMFRDCSGLISVDLSSLTIISGSNGCQYMFLGCSSLSNVNLSSLTTLTGASSANLMFENCTSLTSLSFPSLTTTSFGSRTNQFDNMVRGVTGCTVHFPSNIQATIGSWASVTGGFGGTNTTVLFDLPATNTLTGVDTKTYTRNPKYDTQTSLAWKVGAYGTTDFTPAYYTSGTSDPTTGATIYSDSSCTTAVTTISSIA